jgi:hypothetical protein
VEPQDRRPGTPGRIDDLLFRVRARPMLYGAIAVAAVIVVIVLLIVVLGSGGGDEPGTEPVSGGTVTTSTPGATTSVPVAPATTTAGSVPADRNPLTGAALPALRNDRVIAVKVDNAPEAGPPIGIQDAEMIIEVPVEGGATRFTALFFENAPNVVGPIRSVRPVDADLLAPFRPLLVTTGGQDFVYRELTAAGIDILDEGSDGVFQVTERRRPYHLVTTIPLVEERAGVGPPSVAVFPFGDDDLGGEPATDVEIPFSGVADVTWSYDAGSGGYSRAVNGTPFEVYPTYEAELGPFSTDTVVVLLAAQRSAGYHDSAGADVPTFDVIGYGDLLVFHGGEVRTGQWLRSSQADGWVFVDDTGASFTLPPGRVFVEVVPRQLDVTYR